MEDRLPRAGASGHPTELITLKSLVWFRNDLRLTDNPALAEAAAHGSFEAVFLLAEDQWRDHDVSPWRVALLLRALKALAEDLAQRGIVFHVLDAPSFADAPRAIANLAVQQAAEAVYFNAEYPLNERRRDADVATALDEIGVRSVACHGSVVKQPGSVLTGDGKPYTVFTPFKKRWFASLSAGAFDLLPAPEPQSGPLPAAHIPGELGGVSGAFGADAWPAGEQTAKQALERFLEERHERYAESRDRPDLHGTSVLSHHLSLGSLSPNQCLSALSNHCDPAEDMWASEIVWREFYRHVVAAFDHVSCGFAFRREYDAVAWERNSEAFEAWQEGRTGYPLVDAGMRQLNATGWMHNRLRMVTAMFLSKHLLLDWRLGERYFMQQLIDGDFAANNGGWQWSASTGTDAAPYFRIFNPVTQAKRFDPDGAFVRRWVPELEGVDSRTLFEPWRKGGVPGYVEPIVEHRAARERALERFKAL